MLVESHVGPYEKNSEIDNLIIAAAAASGDCAAEGENGSDGANVGTDPQKIGFWRPVVLQEDHLQALKSAAIRVCEISEGKSFEPEPLNRKQGSEIAYQEMATLMDFRGESDSPYRIDLMRKHSMIFRPAGTTSRALTLYEQAVNESAAQITFRFPAAIYHKRDLAILAKQAVRMTGLEFPNLRSNYFPPGSIIPDKPDSGELARFTEKGAKMPIQPSLAAPASASMLLQKSGALTGKRDESRCILSNEDCAAIVQTVVDMAPTLPRVELKDRQQCGLFENFVYTDALRIGDINPERLDDEMDYIRDVSVVYGRYQSGPRNPNAYLSPYELGVNEAAAWLVRFQPSLLTHPDQLADLARRVIASSGLQLRHSGGNGQQTPHTFQSIYGSRRNPTGNASMSHLSLGGGVTVGGSSDVVQIRLQGDVYPSGDQLTGDLFTSAHSSGGVLTAPYYISEPGSGAFISGFEDGMGDDDTGDHLAASGLDSTELVHFLGGSQVIAQLSDSQLEAVGQTQFIVCDRQSESELANCPLDLSAEEDVCILDEREILRTTRCKSLDAVRVLSVPASGYTCVSTVHLARCVNLRELDLSENALRVFPRRLHLPQLRRLSITGNRFIHLPLVEQFPQLIRLNVDEKLKQLLSPQMLAYFCPQLKLINGQYFDEQRSDFTIRVIQEARTIVEPHIRSKWEAEFADRYNAVCNREERIHLIDDMVHVLKERNLLMDEALSGYKDLMLFQFVDDFIRTKVVVHDPAGLLSPVSSRQQQQQQQPFSSIDLDSEDLMLSPTQSGVTAHSDDQVDVADEKEVELRATAERTLFEATDELLGVNLPDPALMATTASAVAGQLQTTYIVDNMGRLLPQQIFLPAQQQSQHQQQPSQLIASQQGGQYQVHLGKSLRQGRSIVLTVVRPRGVSGRPVAEFLPGELRNKDYVKGYMASEIYKKAVKDTLGQKATPKKRMNLSQARRPDQQPGWAGSPISALASLGDLDVVELASGKRLASSRSAQSVARSGGKQLAGGGCGDFDVASGTVATSGALVTSSSAVATVSTAVTSSTGSLPPRPKKRKSMGMHRSLRDLCSDSSAYFMGSGSSVDHSLTAGCATAAAVAAAANTATGSRSDTSPIDYDPLHFIRCHAKDNDAGDSETKVWRCLFEPNPHRTDDTTHVVATCGGECVCLINCETGKVMKRFKHMEEEFLTIAWTTVEVEGGKRTNILAAAGRMREIRLLHPEQLVCYAEMKGHIEDITAMIFHQTQPTILFSGDSKASVLVWDIGVPSVPDYKTRYQLLMRLRCPRLDVNPVLNLVFLPHYTYLIAGCEDGLFAWKVTDFRLEKREREPDMELKLDVEHEVCIDALAQLSDNALVLKVVESGEIMVFDFASVLERRKGLQRLVPIEMRGHLLWQKTDEIYINVSVRQNLGAVLCGDNEGSIWIYDLDPYLDDLHASSRKRFHVKPIKILEWPECSVQGNRDEDQQLKESITSGFRNPVVNSVEMSSDGYYLAAVTDNNLVCIWRYAPPQQQQLVPAQAATVQPTAVGGSLTAAVSVSASVA